MILLTILLCLVSFYLIGVALGYRQFSISIHYEDVGNFGFGWTSERMMKKHFPKQYVAGYRFMLLLLVYKFKLGIILK